MGTDIRVHLNSSFDNIINRKQETKSSAHSEQHIIEKDIVLNIDDGLKKFIMDKLDIISSSEDEKTNNKKTKFSCS